MAEPGKEDEEEAASASMDDSAGPVKHSVAAPVPATEPTPGGVHGAGGGVVQDGEAAGAAGSGGGGGLGEEEEEEEEEDANENEEAGSESEDAEEQGSTMDAVWRGVVEGAVEAVSGGATAEEGSQGEAGGTESPREEGDDDGMARSARTMSFLKSIPVFQRLREAQFHHLVTSFRRRRYAPGDRIIVQGVRGDQFFVVEEGEVAIMVKVCAPLGPPACAPDAHTHARVRAGPRAPGHPWEGGGGGAGWGQGEPDSRGLLLRRAGPNHEPAAQRHRGRGGPRGVPHSVAGGVYGDAVGGQVAAGRLPGVQAQRGRGLPRIPVPAPPHHPVSRSARLRAGAPRHGPQHPTPPRPAPRNVRLCPGVGRERCRRAPHQGPTAALPGMRAA